MTCLEAWDMFPQTAHVESLCVLEKSGWEGITQPGTPIVFY